MKTKTLTPISELRNSLSLSPREITYRLSSLKRQFVDFDVFLPSKDKNLQRDFVWTLEQKREIILSIINNRHIPHISLISTVGVVNNIKQDYDVLQIIDGKQRLSSMFSFLDNGFTIILEGDEYLFSELPEDYQKSINTHSLKTYEVLEDYDVAVTDEEKIQWFKFLNFSGTPQDEEHMNNL